MADDLASFIESQKRKLEKERSEILLGQGGEDRSRTSPRGSKPDERHFQGDPAASSEPRSKVKGLEEDNSIGGLKLGGYEKHQEKLRQERKEEYRKYLAEKNFRSSGKVDPILLDNRKPPVSGYNSTEKQSRRDENDSGDYLNRSRRKGKENLDSNFFTPNMEY